MASRRTPNQPTHRHTSHHQDSANAHASSSHSTDIPNRSASRTPQGSLRYNPVEDPHAFDMVGRYTGGDTGSRSGPRAPETYAPSYMSATSSNNPSNMAMDNSWYPPAQGTHSSGMPEISAPAPQSFGYAAQWPPASSSLSSWNFPPPGPLPQRPPLPSRHATPRPYAPSPPPAVPPLPYAQQSHAGPSGPSSLQHAGPSTSSLRGKATLKPRKSAGKMGIPSWHLHKMKLPSLMGRSKSKSGGAAPPLQPPASVQGPQYGGYRDTDEIRNDNDDDGMYGDDNTVNDELSAKQKKQEYDLERSRRNRDQIKGLIQRLDRLLLWSESEKPPHTNAQCLEKAIEWVGDSVRNAVWRDREAQLLAAIRERDEIASRYQNDAAISAAEATMGRQENTQLRQTVRLLQERLAEYSKYVPPNLR